ncbi:hypothetical protein RND81_02G209900 [Saponaria officinalis]|uniref:Reverse transcriptase domain-containing protein n=1 Tax=Saponaria officinalis TaxID=3572 RepID=A0AAW1MW28_SAPOF
MAKYRKKHNNNPSNTSKVIHTNIHKHKETLISENFSKSKSSTNHSHPSSSGASPLEPLHLDDHVEAEAHGDDDGGWTEVNRGKKATDVNSGMLRFTVDDRVWKNLQVDGISSLPNGVFIVRFKDEESKNRALASEFLMFDSKRVIIQPWTPGCSLVKKSCLTLPIWVKFRGLDLKFWGANCLAKLAGLIGKFVRCDVFTANKTFLGFAKVLVEVELNQFFPRKLSFLDEADILQEIDVDYDWIPVECSGCKALGHTVEQCRKNKPKKVWRPKVVQTGAVVAPGEKVTQTEGVVATGEKMASTSDAHVPINDPGGCATETPRVPIVPSSSPARILSRVTRHDGKGMHFSSEAISYLEILTSSLQKALGESGGGGGGGGWVMPFLSLSMDKLGFWNVRGMNSLTKQNEIKWFLFHNKAGLFSLLETRVRSHNWSSIHNNICSDWSVITNNACHEGERIWLLWNPILFDVEVLDTTIQSIHVRVKDKCRKLVFLLTTVYGLNKMEERRALWHSIRSYGVGCTDPWIVWGDFNNVLFPNERIGYVISWAEIRDFQQCLDSVDLLDAKLTGSFFTWNNKQEGEARVFSRIDRVVVNSQWYDMFPDSYGHFLPEGLFDHCPCVVQLFPDQSNSPRSFKYFNMWSMDEKFIQLVTGCWNIRIHGTPMYQLVQKTKNVKKELMTLNRGRFSDVENRYTIACKALESVQLNMQADIYSLELRATERALNTEWMKEGEENTAYFHSVIKQRRQVNKRLLGQANVVRGVHLPTHKNRLMAEITGDKAPGPDGFTSQFYKDAWSVSFFSSSKLLKEMNHTLLTLIPKVVMPSHVSQFRPIACCNTIYKCITKVICNRLGGSAFIQGRDIVGNILICQDLVRLYNRKCCSPRVLMKWEFIRHMLIALDFPDKVIDWIMECVSTPTYSLGQRGIRQGDPLSPLLFTILAQGFDDFKFHSLCKRARLTHLCFADDLLLFCYGNRASVTTIMRAFLTFSSASGLKMNQQKSSIYANGVPNNVLGEILRVTGVPISSKKLSILEIRAVGTRHLSYAGRLTLIKSVLATLHSYWAHDICRNFLWNGTYHYMAPPLVSWDQVLYEYNIASIAKYIWWLASKKDHLWVKWSEFGVTSSSSWAWKRMCKVRDIMIAGYNGNWWQRIGNHYTVKQGYDWLCPAGTSVDWYHQVWNRLCLPKHSFICWLYAHSRLQTKVRMSSHGYSGDISCCICSDSIESMQHLFFSCPYSASCVQVISAKLGIFLPVTDTWSWWERHCFKSFFHKKFVGAARNHSFHNSELIRPKIWSKTLLSDLIFRCKHVVTSNVNSGHLSWIENM